MKRSYWFNFASVCFEGVIVFGSAYIGVMLGLRFNEPLTNIDWVVIIMIISSIFIRSFFESWKK